MYIYIKKQKYIKNTTKINFRLLNYEINDILKGLKLELKHEALKNRYYKILDSYEDEINLRLEAKEKINEIERLKKELRDKEDILLTIKTRFSKILTDLEYEKEDILHDIMISQSKLRKLGISSRQINEIKISILSS